MLILEEAAPLVAGFGSKMLPPTILTWRDLQILEGIAEQGRGGRISNYSSCGGSQLHEAAR